VENDTNYKAYRKGRKISPVVQKLLAETGLVLSEGGGIPQLIKFQENCRQYKLTVYRGLAFEDIIFERQVDSPKKINLLYDDVEQHYHVIVNITGAMTKRFICNACTKSCASAATHHCEQTCSDCMAIPPCAFTGDRLLCADCNRYFRSHTFFANHKQSTSNKKSICERRRKCSKCGAFVTRGNHECNKRYCKICNQNRDVGHLCYMRPLKDVLPDYADNILYIFYVFETTQNKTYSDTSNEHVPKLVCVQQFCARCEEIDYCGIGCDRCGSRSHSLWNDPVGDLLSYLCEPRPWAN